MLRGPSDARAWWRAALARGRARGRERRGARAGREMPLERCRGASEGEKNSESRHPDPAAALGASAPRHRCARDGDDAMGLKLGRGRARGSVRGKLWLIGKRRRRRGGRGDAAFRRGRSHGALPRPPCNGHRAGDGGAPRDRLFRVNPLCGLAAEELADALPDPRRQGATTHEHDAVEVLRRPLHQGKGVLADLERPVDEGVEDRIELATGHREAPHDGLSAGQRT